MNGMPNFWGYLTDKTTLDDSFKDWIYHQYLSKEELSIYCKSNRSSHGTMGIGVAYVQAGSVIVKRKYVYPPASCSSIVVYGELKALEFAISNFSKHRHSSSSIIRIYSNIDYIDRLMDGNISFKRRCLEEAKKHLLSVYKQTISQHHNMSLEIDFLEKNRKSHNPFYVSAHNASRTL